MKIIETNNVIRLKIYTEIAKQMNAKFNKNRSKIQDEIRNLSRIALLSSNTYESLTSGELNVHFGFPVGTATYAVDTIVGLIVSKINLTHIQAKASSAGINSNLYINLYRGTQDILEIGQAYIETDKYNLPWLKWLLTEGDKIIISGYDIRLESGKGRSDGGIMVTNNSGVWRVPPEYAGTEDNNWITQTFSSPAYQQALESILSKYL